MIYTSSLFKTEIFKNVSFELESGVLCVLSKKPERSSSLLCTLARVKKADGGELRGNENVAFIPSGCSLPKTLTAEEYLKFVLEVKKEATLPEKTLHLTEDIFKKSIGSLTPFERLTLGVAASLIGNPEVLVLEQPYYDLSYEDYGDLRHLILSVLKKNAVIFSSSSVFECKDISDKTLVMSVGNQIYFGDTKKLFENEINETDICCLVKGKKESIAKAFERYTPKIDETVREEVFFVTVKNVPIFKAAETRSRIKKLLSKTKLSLLEIKSEKEALLNIIRELSENDRKKKSDYEESKPVKITKITKSVVAFSHGDDEIEEGEDEELDESKKGQNDDVFS